MAILREWRAEVRCPLKKEYVDYVPATGLVAYRGQPAGSSLTLFMIDR